MLSLIVAFNANYVIGKDNKLIWHISEDLKRFKNITIGKTIIMGRKTFESLPKVLPNRKHIVITRDMNYTFNDSSVEVIHDIKEVLKYQESSDEFIVIGGGQIYKELLPYCQKLYLTKVHSFEEGDAYFPEFNPFDYEILEGEMHTPSDGVPYDFVTLQLRERKDKKQWRE